MVISSMSIAHFNVVVNHNLCSLHPLKVFLALGIIELSWMDKRVHMDLYGLFGEFVSLFWIEIMSTNKIRIIFQPKILSLNECCHVAMSKMASLELVKYLPMSYN